MRLTCLLTVTASILVLAGAGAAARPAKRRADAPVARSLTGNEIENPTKTDAVGPGATGEGWYGRRFSWHVPGSRRAKIDGVYGDDFGIAVRGYQEDHGLKPTGTIDAEMWRLLDSGPGPEGARFYRLPPGTRMP
jgi:peptidoglycan hydrolase-like protein with peptidoglycan-binding domain